MIEEFTYFIQHFCLTSQLLKLSKLLSSFMITVFSSTKAWQKVGKISQERWSWKASWNHIEESRRFKKRESIVYYFATVKLIAQAIVIALKWTPPTISKCPSDQTKNKCKRVCQSLSWNTILISATIIFCH